MQNKLFCVAGIRFLFSALWCDVCVYHPWNQWATPRSCAQSNLVSAPLHAHEEAPADIRSTSHGTANHAKSAAAGKQTRSAESHAEQTRPIVTTKQQRSARSIYQQEISVQPITKIVNNRKTRSHWAGLSSHFSGTCDGFARHSLE